MSDLSFPVVVKFSAFDEKEIGVRNDAQGVLK